MSDNTPPPADATSIRTTILLVSGVLLSILLAFLLATADRLQLRPAQPMGPTAAPALVGQATLVLTPSAGQRFDQSAGSDGRRPPHVDTEPDAANLRAGARQLDAIYHCGR